MSWRYHICTYSQCFSLGIWKVTSESGNTASQKLHNFPIVPRESSSTRVYGSLLSSGFFHGITSNKVGTSKLSLKHTMKQGNRILHKWADTLLHSLLTDQPGPFYCLFTGIPHNLSQLWTSVSLMTKVAKLTVRGLGISSCNFQK